MLTDAEPVNAETSRHTTRQQNLLQHQEYRDLLQVLANAETPLSARELAKQVTGQPSESAPAARSSAQRRLMLARVRHVYLPHLESHGVVTTGPKGKPVQLTGAGVRLVRKLDPPTE